MVPSMISNAEVCYFQPDRQYRVEAGENQSSLKHILTSPAHYLASKQRRFMPSPVMTIGTATHCKVLEGDEIFESSFVKKPDDIKFTSKEGKEWKDRNSKKTILANDGQYRQWDAVMGMSERLRQLEWFDPSQKDYRKFNEVSIYWDYEDIRCKARLDRVLVLEDEVIVVDLKTTDSVNVDKFQSKLIDLGYDFQAGWYASAAEAIYGKPARFIFVAIERNDPYTVDLFEVPDFMLEEAKRKNELALQLLRDCKKSGDYPAPLPTLKKLDYPKWYSPLDFDKMNQTTKSLEPLF